MNGLEALKRLEQSCYTIDPVLHNIIEKELKALEIIRKHTTIMENPTMDGIVVSICFNHNHHTFGFERVRTRERCYGVSSVNQPYSKDTVDFNILKEVLKNE